MALKYTNALIDSSSPYLLQHAHNPVNWQPWSELIPMFATKENKLILVSIGYSACHWCHVMEHESFEDEDVAKIMNKHFICVKVDREERPDVDQYYMTAVQLMQEQGGWPLNVIALPDGRPVWGGTYFPKEIWMKNLLAISGFYHENRSKTEEYAANLQNGIQQVLLKTSSDDVIPATKKLTERSFEGWKKKFDMENGGMLGQPKFPMPVTLDFLLYYGYIQKDDEVFGFVDITLQKMARGGIYDQIGGGFARYSVDGHWKIPHFEKMLYDNGQLLSVYSKGFQLFRNEEYKTVVYETVNFIECSLADKSNAFYSSLDADSEGEEGRFYVWKPRDLKEILLEDFALFADYFNVNEKGFWELGNYILLREGSDEEFAAMHKIELAELYQKITVWKSKLLEFREKRVPPGLDDKTLTSWNALAIQGLTDAYHVFREERFIQLAENNAEFLLANVFQADGKLFHIWKNGKSSVDGFLEDYALFMQACISLFEKTGKEKWLDTAVNLNDYVFENFFDNQKGLFYFTENKTDSVISNHFQTEDNVISSSNSIMANNLYSLYLLLGKPEYLVIAKQLLHHVTAQFARYPMAYANWGTLMLKLTHPHFEVVVCGENAKEPIARLQKKFRPDVIWVYSENEKDIPILRSRFKKGKTLIYVCHEGICQLPVEGIDDAEKLLVTK